MMNIIKWAVKNTRKCLYYFYFIILTRYYKIIIGVKWRVNGFPIIKVSKRGHLLIGNYFQLNSGMSANIIGRQQPCILSVSSDATLTIGDNVGISSTAIICAKGISIGNNVRIGGNTCIYDTDFHSLITTERVAYDENKNNVTKINVMIKDNVFIGAHATILKGVTIGENSIIGACSVVTKNIPENQIWAGNPARFIKNIY